MKIPLAGIYKITHKSGYFYIGKSVDIFSRWSSHYTILKQTKHHSPAFQKLYSNSKVTDWTFEVLFTLSKTELKDKTGLKGAKLDRIFNSVLLSCEKDIMKRYSVKLALNKQNKSFS